MNSTSSGEFLWHGCTGLSATPRDLSNGPLREYNSSDTRGQQSTSAKRRPSDEQEVFFTAPSPPVASPVISDSSVADHDEFDDSDLDDIEINTMSRTDDAIDDAQKRASPKKIKQRQSTIHEFLKTIKPLPGPATEKHDAVGSGNKPELSFSTTASSSYLGLRDSRTINTSFETNVTDLTDPMDYDSTQNSSIVN
jgi:hypothetical protein